MFLLVSVRHVGTHPGGHQHGVSIQISINLGKHFFGYLVYEIFLWPESWRGSLHIYLLSFPRFWTLSIERFCFLFWSILNGVTLKTSNMWVAQDSWPVKATPRSETSETDIPVEVCCSPHQDFFLVIMYDLAFGDVELHAMISAPVV